MGPLVVRKRVLTTRRRLRAPRSPARDPPWDTARHGQGQEERRWRRPGTKPDRLKRASWLLSPHPRACTGRVDAATAALFCYFAPEFAHRLTAQPFPRRTQVTEDFAIQPEKITPTLDASKWPLLLKNYDKLMVREADHPTPPTQFEGSFSREHRETRVC